MNSEQWQLIARTFGDAVPLPPDERDDFLETALKEHPEIEAEVRSLLANHDEEPEFLEQPISRVSDLGSDQEMPAASVRIGPYRVLEQIGTGGMGTVLLAERDDDQYRQKVAIKLVKRGMDSEQILARFRAERQILASLAHPQIARIYDGGIADDGRPYFVLEYIEDALPIDRYCQENGLTTRRRLELFRQVCDAVQYAHRKLIIHRDLKPSNLLVSRSGEVKLLDFGIAKLLDPSTVDLTQMNLTHAELRLLTPEYASPEQVRKEALSTTSDVYSLGVVLYRVLTGKSPYRVDGDSPLTIADAICEQQPRKPSTVVRTASGSDTDAALATGRESLEGDLDNIVLKALRKEPDARYRSVDALSEDIRRFLEKRPVLARPLTAGYRLRRFVQRHTLAVALSTLSGLLLIAGIAGTAWQAIVARQERDRARAEAAKAEQVADVLVDLFDMSNPDQTADANSLTLRDFADRAQGEIVGELEDQPEVLARLETVMGRLNTSLARPQEARALLESALRRQREIFPDGHLDLVETLHRYSDLLRAERDFDGAQAAAAEALKLRKQLVETDDLGVADLLQQLSFIAGSRGDYSTSQAILEQAYAIRRRLLPDNHLIIGQTQGALATLHYRRGELEQAIDLGQKALAIVREDYGDIHQDVAHELNNLGAFYYANGDYDLALATHREALRVRTAVFGAEHPFVGFSLGHLGKLALLLGDPATALDYQEKAHGLRMTTLGPDHPQTLTARANLGATNTALGKAELGREQLSQGVEGLRGQAGGHARLAGALVELGHNHAAAGRTTEAIESYREAVALRETVSGVEHPRTAQAQVALATALIDGGDHEEAAALLDIALATFGTSLPEGHLDTAAAWQARGALEQARGASSDARNAYQRALAVLVAKLPAGHSRISAVHDRLAGID